MTTEKMIEELYKVAGQHKNDVVGVGELNIHAMCTDVASRLKELYEQTKLATDTNVGNKWIPCSERLPNDTAIHEVTAKFSNGTIYTEFAYYNESIEEWWKFDDDGIVNVIAWKEHSEPYKEGDT